MKTNYLFKVYLTVILCIASIVTFAQPSIGGYNVYYGSLHNHSNVSDGQGTPDQAYAYAKNTAHLDFFGLADHSTVMTSSQYTQIKNAANVYNQDGVFATFYGFEWTTILSYGHVAVIQTEDYCYGVSPTGTFSDLLNWLNARNGIAFLNHPGWDATEFMEFNHFNIAPSDKVVGIELWNGGDGFGTYYYNDGYDHSDGGKGYFDEALIRKWKIGAAGSEDNHSATWGTATNYRVGVLAPALSRTEILNAFRARRFFATTDKNIAFSFQINGSEMGSTIAGGNLTMVISAKDGDGEKFIQAVLVKNGTVAKTLTTSTTDLLISESITCSDGDYFYARVKQEDGNEAISSPVFISGTVNVPPVVAITNPANGASFAAGSVIPITASATDADGSVARVEFYDGSVLLGTDTTSPYEFQWTGASAGSHQLTAKAFDNLTASAISAPVSITVIQQTTVSVTSSISSGTDDAEEYKSGTVILNSDDLDLVYDTKTTGNQTVGLLFRNLAIPQGSTITKAYIQFTCDERTTNTCSLTIKGQLSGSAAEFVASSGNLSARPKTSAGVSWVPQTWKTVGSQGSAQQTPEIKTVLQEIVNLSGWGASSNLVILISGSGTRTAESYEGLPAKAPYLYIEYISTAGSAPVAMKGGSSSDVHPSVTEESALEDVIQVYPNPVTDRLTIRIKGEIDVQRIMVYSVTGNLVTGRIISGNPQNIEVDCSNYTPGTYILQIQSNEGNYPFRFIKQ